MGRVWCGNSVNFDILFKASSYFEAFFIWRKFAIWSRRQELPVQRMSTRFMEWLSMD